MMSDMRKQFHELLANAGFINHMNERECSKHDGNITLVKAVLCAGLFPNVASVASAGRKARMRTWQDGKVEAHPGSVNAWCASSLIDLIAALLLFRGLSLITIEHGHSKRSLHHRTVEFW